MPHYPTMLIDLWFSLDLKYLSKASVLDLVSGLALLGGGGSPEARV